jgi:ABC-type sulfate transport system permease component
VVTVTASVTASVTAATSYRMSSKSVADTTFSVMLVFPKAVVTFLVLALPFRNGLFCNSTTGTDVNVINNTVIGRNNIVIAGPSGRAV